MLVKRCETVSCCARKEDAQLSSSLSHTASSFPIPPISSLLLFLLLVACPILCAPFAAHFLHISSLYPCFSGSLCVRVRVCGCYLVSVFFLYANRNSIFFETLLLFLPIRLPFFFGFFLSVFIRVVSPPPSPLLSLSPPVVSPVVSCSWCCVCLPCCVNPCTHLCEEVVRRRYWKSLIPVNPLVCKSGSFVFWCSLLSSVLSFLYFRAITNHLLRLSSIIFD